MEKTFEVFTNKKTGLITTVCTLTTKSGRTYRGVTRQHPADSDRSNQEKANAIAELKAERAHQKDIVRALKWKTEAHMNYVEFLTRELASERAKVANLAEDQSTAEIIIGDLNDQIEKLANE